MFSSEYGWDTDKVFDLPMLEIEWRVEKIVERQNNSNHFQAGIHGVQLKKSKGSAADMPEITKEQILAGRKAMEQLKNGKRSKT